MSGCDVGGTSERSSSAHLRDGVEDLPELAREPVDLVVGELEPRESRHVQHLLSRLIAIVPPILPERKKTKKGRKNKRAPKKRQRPEAWRKKNRKNF